MFDLPTSLNTRQEDEQYAQRWMLEAVWLSDTLLMSQFLRRIWEHPPLQSFSASKVVACEADSTPHATLLNLALVDNCG